MRRTLPALALLALVSAPAFAGASGGVLLGKVSADTLPLAEAAVFAYQMADKSTEEVVTDGQGSFLFDELPAGLYKIIAFKKGFLPAVVLLTREEPADRQYLQLQLRSDVDSGEQVASASDFWAIRERIPDDVLRRIDTVDPMESLTPLDRQGPRLARFEATMQALSGVRQSGALGESQMTGGRVDLQGRFEDTDIELVGNYVELAPGRVATSPLPGQSAGETRMVALNLEHGDNTRVFLSSVDNHMLTPRNRTRFDTADLEGYRLRWSQSLGENSRSEFAANYFEESGYYRSGLIRPRSVPLASRVLDVSGGYETELSERSSVEARVRYRSREADLLGSAVELPAQRVDLFGGGGLQMRPTMRVEYGLYSTLQDGSVSFAPRGEMVFQLSPRWSAETVASHRMNDRQSEELRDFFVTFFSEIDTCQQLEDSCYQVLARRSLGDDQELSLGITQREYGETVQLFFSEDFFDHLESVYLVRGDTMPELEFALTKRLSPFVWTRFESNIAQGGGGLVYGQGNRVYENSVRYLVTSLDTQFEKTSTGLFVSFHRLEQVLSPLHNAPRGLGPDVERERLQVAVTQDLDFLQSLANRLAVQLNMELSRGNHPEQNSGDDGAIKKRVMGGIAVSF